MIRIVFSKVYHLFQMCNILKEVFIKVTYYFNFTYIFSIFIVYILYYIRLIRLSGDIEVNPGPKPSSFKNFSICHWNLNSITSHDMTWSVLITPLEIDVEAFVFIMKTLCPLHQNLNYQSPSRMHLL